MMIQIKPIKSQEDADRELERFDKRIAEIDAIAEKIRPVHHECIVIERLDVRQLELPFEVGGKKENIHRSYLARVLKISEVAGSEIQEDKKKLVKKGDIINHLPNAVWSVDSNDYYEIWTCSIDAVIAVMEDYGYREKFKAKLDNHVLFADGMKKAAPQNLEAGEIIEIEPKIIL